MAMADLLSLHSNGTGGGMDSAPPQTHFMNPNSVSRCVIHMTPCVAELSAIYSASQLESATVSCFLHCQSTQQLPKRISQPVVDLRVSLQPPQLASTNTTTGD